MNTYGITINLLAGQNPLVSLTLDFEEGMPPLYVQAAVSSEVSHRLNVAGVSHDELSTTHLHQAIRRFANDLARAADGTARDQTIGGYYRLTMVRRNHPESAPSPYHYVVRTHHHGAPAYLLFESRRRLDDWLDAVFAAAEHLTEQPLGQGADVSRDGLSQALDNGFIVSFSDDDTSYEIAPTKPR